MANLNRIFGNVLQAVLPDLQKTPSRNRKIVIVGLVRLLTQSTYMRSPPGSAQWSGRDHTKP